MPAATLEIANEEHGPADGQLTAGVVALRPELIRSDEPVKLRDIKETTSICHRKWGIRGRTKELCIYDDA